MRCAKLKQERKREKSTKKAKGNLKNLIGCCLILILFLAALFLPELYFAYSDKKNEDELAYIDVEMDAYQLRYDSMLEKLQTLGEGEIAGWEMQVTLLQETTDSEKRSHLTERVNDEILDYGVEYFGYETQCTVEELASCRLYTIYPEEELEKGFQGISFWQLIYEQEESVIKVILDTEFEKIYALSINETSAVEEVSEKNAFNSNLYTIEENFGVLEIEGEGIGWIEEDFYAEDEWAYIWLETLSAYYDLEVSVDINWSIGWGSLDEKYTQIIRNYFRGYSDYTTIGTLDFSFLGAEYREIGLASCMGIDVQDNTEVVMGLVMMFEYLQL